MKSLVGFPLAVWLCLVFSVNSRDVVLRSEVQAMPEEREITTREKLDAYMASKDDNTGDIVDLAKAGLEGIAALTQIDYSQSGGQIAWEVAQAVVPIIGAALAFVPVVGVVVSGLFMGLWSLISPIFAPKKDNPMEKMINELAKKLNKRIDEKLSNLVNLAIYGEIGRNNYICNKYTYISQNYTNDFKMNTALEEKDAMKLVMYLNDCDNFLKDTAEAFVYEEYADVLWVPSAITTSVRLAFLAEVLKNGRLMGLQRNVLAMYLQDLKKDTQRHFAFHAKGLDKVHKGSDSHNRNKNYMNDVSKVAMAACQLQSQFFYFDREIYPYGIPTILNNTDMFANIKMQDYHTPVKGINIKHLQIFFNVTKSKFPSHLPGKQDSYGALEFLNCLLGPMHLASPNTYWFNFHALPAGNKYSYEFRVMFHQTKVYTAYDGFEVAAPILSEIDKGSALFKEYSDVNKKSQRKRES